MISTSSLALPQFLGAKVADPNPSRPSIHLNPHRPSHRISAVHSSSPATAPQFRAKASLYHVLGLESGATGTEIKAAYRKLARTCHPDVKGDAADEFIKIHTAYSTLSDPDKRADYDRTLIGTMRRSVRSGFGYPRRTWETDQCW